MENETARLSGIGERVSNATKERDETLASLDTESKEKLDALDAEKAEKLEALNAEYDQKRDEVTTEYAGKKDEVTANTETTMTDLKAEFVAGITAHARMVFQELLNTFLMTEDREAFDPHDVGYFRTFEELVNTYTELVPKAIVDAVVKVQPGADYSSIYLDLDQQL
jgi:hypothetical protein